MSDEQLWIRLPELTEIALDGSFRPSVVFPVQRTRNLKRAWNCTRIRDLADKLPTPVARIYTGEVDLTALYPDEGEAMLSLYLAELNWQLQTATHISRDRRVWEQLQDAYAIAVPIDDDSGRAAVTLDVLTLHVPDTRIKQQYHG